MRTIVVTPPLSTPEVKTLGDLGRHVRHRRTKSGLRIDDAAALCGVASGSMSKLENGQVGMSTDKLLRILDGLGLVLMVVPREDVGELLASHRETPSK
ncbi:MAG: helix-turn-helix domain-containing protein [Ferrovum myxofaciens]|uniref:helix-turn-helix domain-containing protein n=1 Tax=Ferrovum myxofaciens TaxID=416213 RepID=UPI002352C157|nr:helix-turn-helix domain-containing protein [Ferrovum myxofaciens]QKE40753.1 MAG: helix-turn-helix domain-containing protein [Ferrovum myxofaciens]